MANGITLKVDSGPYIVTSGPSNFKSDAGLTTAVTYPVTVTTDTVWYCSPAVAVAVPDATFTVTQLDGTTIMSGQTIRVGQTTDTYLRPEPTRGQVAADVAPDRFGVFTSGNYYTFGTATGASSGGTTAVGTLKLAPYWIHRVVTLDKIGASIVSAGGAGSVYRIGIYSDSAGFPGALVKDCGTIDGTSATVQDIDLSPDVTLPVGLYWVGGVAQVGTLPTIRQQNVTQFPTYMPLGTSTPTSGQSIGGLLQTGVTGALPASFTWTAGNQLPVTEAPRIHFKVA